MNNEVLGGKPFIPECEKHKGQNWLDCIYCAAEKREVDAQNKSHEEILRKYKDSANVGGINFDCIEYYNALLAMAEVAGLRDKEVGSSPYYITDDDFINSIESQLRNAKKQLNEKDKEIADCITRLDLKEGRISQLGKEIEQLKAKANGTYLQSIAPQSG